MPAKYVVSTPFETWTLKGPRLIWQAHRTPDHRAEAAVQVIGQTDDGLLVRFRRAAETPTQAWDLDCQVREGLLSHLRREDEPSHLPRTRYAPAVATTGDATEPPDPDETQLPGNASRPRGQRTEADPEEACPR